MSGLQKTWMMGSLVSACAWTITPDAFAIGRTGPTGPGDVPPCESNTNTRVNCNHHPNGTDCPPESERRIADRHDYLPPSFYPRDIQGTPHCAGCNTEHALWEEVGCSLP